MSSHVVKPNPPKIIKNMIIIFIIFEPDRVVRDEYSPFTPIRSNPALQNADME